MDSYFHRNEIDEIKTKLSGFEINKIERKIIPLSDEDKRRVYKNYYHRKARVVKNIFLILILGFVAFLLYTVPNRISNDKLVSKPLNISQDSTINSLGNIVIFLTSKSKNEFLLQDSQDYFELTVAKDTLYLKVNTNILFLAPDSSKSSHLIKSNDTIILSKKDSASLFYDSNKYFMAELKSQAIQLSLQPNHVLIGAKERMTNLEFFSFHLLIFLGIGILLYFWIMFFGICTKNSIHDYEKHSKISKKIDKLVTLSKEDTKEIIDIAKEIIDISKNGCSDRN
jgi:hypothetical protein